ncbi:MAG: hypothetical protein HY331_12855 [Chloroflexi bacterium]|nr:hypothetical protein [Chloroflexota bacterium]
MSDKHTDLVRVRRPGAGRALTRRQLLALAAGSAFSMGLRGPADPLPATPLAAAPAELRAATPLRVVRAQDLLVLDFSFHNLAIDLDVGALVRADPTRDAYIGVGFQPQSFLEEAVDPSQWPGGRKRALVGGGSWLAFKLPRATQSIPYTLDSLLNWASFEPRLVPAAQPPDPQPGRQPLTGAPPAPVPNVTGPVRAPKAPVTGEPETAIEAPWGLILSPSRYGAWSHALDPVSLPQLDANGNPTATWTELWHTRLGVVQVQGEEDDPEALYRLVRADEANAYYRTVRAVWPLWNAPGAQVRTGGYTRTAPPLATLDNHPFRQSLTPRQRWEIVGLSSDFSLPGARPPIQVDRLMLTALGAWLNVHGAWTPPTSLGFALKGWDHVATMGRDHFVHTVEVGFLFPFGHRAARVTITERVIGREPSIGAYLRKREYIIIVDPEKTYPAAASNQSADGRRFPFKRLRLTTLQTPDLTAAGPNNQIHNLGSSAYWLQVAGAEIQFHLIGEDIAGQRIEFTTPLAFLSASLSPAQVQNVANWYSGSPPQGWPASPLPTDRRRQMKLDGQKMAFAPSSEPGDTTFETASFSLGTRPPAGGGAGRAATSGIPSFLPGIAEADVRLDAVEALTGGNGRRTIVLDETYVSGGFSSANKGAVFARLKPGSAFNPTIELSGDRSGGLATPSMSFSGLSRTFGTVGGNIDNLLRGVFNPADLLGLDAKILGSVSLSQIIGSVLPSEIGSGSTKFPKMTTRMIYPTGPNGAVDPLALPTAVQTCYVWTPPVKDWPDPGPPLFVVDPENLNPTSFSINACLIARLDGSGEPTYEVVGDLQNFAIDLLGGDKSFIVVTFNRLRFTAKSGQKTDVDVDIAEVLFTGPLAFVNSLQTYLQTDGVGLGIDISPSGVKAGYTLAIPTIAVGMLSIQNISLSAGVHIPLTNQPFRMRFAFSERENPFLLTVSMFGGGGFLGLGLGLGNGTDAIELFEAALEFGANISLDFGGGAITGGVYAMAGIYFKMEGDRAELTGYVRMGGNLDVLGILVVSVELYLGLTYDLATDKVWGQARLLIAVEIYGVSETFEYTVERKFSGPSGDPTFEQLVPAQADWDAYCDAFAA